MQLIKEKIVLDYTVMPRVRVSVNFDFTVLKVSRYSNGHKYPKQKQRTPNLTSCAQIGLAIMFTTNSCVKHRILHVLRDADAISHVKTG